MRIVWTVVCEYRLAGHDYATVTTFTELDEATQFVKVRQAFTGWIPAGAESWGVHGPNRVLVRPGHVEPRRPVN